MSFVLVETPRPGICQITLNRPERMNAMAFDVMVPFEEELEEAIVARKEGRKPEFKD